jgi:Zn-dependent protease
MLQDYVTKVILYVLPLLLGVVFHEVAHGWMAEKCGDPTARLRGRITLNPFVHIDLVGTVLLPIILIVTHAPFLFGWAKPVPINFQNLRGGRRDMALVAIAGPATNLLLAIGSSLLYHLMLNGLRSGWIPLEGVVVRIADPVIAMAGLSVSFNLVLMLINLVPIPPLDGGRIAVGLLPLRLASGLDRLENMGMLVLLVLMMTGALGYVVGPVLNLLLKLLL